MIAAEPAFPCNECHAFPFIPAMVNNGDPPMTNQNNPGQQNQNPGQKPGQQQQGGGQKPGQQQQDPGREKPNPNRQGKQMPDQDS
jgi:hypothetical protein